MPSYLSQFSYLWRLWFSIRSCRIRTLAFRLLFDCFCCSLLFSLPRSSFCSNLLPLFQPPRSLRLCSFPPFGSFLADLVPFLDEKAKPKTAWKAACAAPHAAVGEGSARLPPRLPLLLMPAAVPRLRSNCSTLHSRSIVELGQVGFLRALETLFAGSIDTCSTFNTDLY